MANSIFINLSLGRLTDDISINISMIDEEIKAQIINEITTTTVATTVATNVAQDLKEHPFNNASLLEHYESLLKDALSNKDEAVREGVEVEGWSVASWSERIVQLRNYLENLKK